MGMVNLSGENVQNNFYIKGQAVHLDLIERVTVGTEVEPTGFEHTLRVRLRTFHKGSPGSYARVELWSGNVGWVEVLDWHIQDLYCRHISYLSDEATNPDPFIRDAQFLIVKALEVIEGRSYEQAK